MAEARCPASCGELLQGWILGSEKLISCPINWYSTVSVESRRSGRTSGQLKPMMQRALNATLQHFKIDDVTAEDLCLNYNSSIPVAKGMASSTADIAATIVATARYLHQTMDEATLATLATRLEPTDSVICAPLALMDHNSGVIHSHHVFDEPIDILMLEGRATLTTSAYHQQVRHAALKASEPALNRAWMYFQQACAQHSATQLGVATTLSAIESQKILPKPYFTELLRLMEQFDLYGLNTAHSGSVMGLLLNGRRHDTEKIIATLRRLPLSQAYPTLHQVSLIDGGVR